MARIAWVLLGVAVLGLAAALGWALSLDPNQHKAAIERWASDALGDRVQIGGPIELTRGLTSKVVVNDLRISAAGQAAPMVSIGRAEVSLVLTSLLWGPLHLTSVALDTAQLDLPLPGAPSMGAGHGQVPRIDRLEVSNIKVSYREDDGATFAFAVERAAVAPAADGATTTLDMTATVAAVPVKVSGSTGPVAALFASGQDFPVRIQAMLADGTLDLTGSLSLQGGDLAYRLESKLALPAGSKLAESYRLPALPLAATAKLEGNRTTLAMRALAATWGRSDLAGEMAWQAGQGAARGKLSGKVTAQRIDLAEIGRGSPSDASKSDKAGDGVVPNLALPSPAGLPVDLDLEATVGQLGLAGDAMTDVKLTVGADQSRVDLSVTQAALGGGTVQGRYQAAGQAPDVVFGLDAKGVDLASLTPDPNDGTKLPQDVSVKIDLTGRGADLPGALGSAKGAIAIETGPAVIDETLVNLIGQSLFTALIRGFTSSSDARIVCGVLDLEATDGKARSTALVIDTDRIVVGGGGAIDLATGKIDFVLLPKAKKATLAPLVAPVHLTGTIIDPQVAGDAGSILSSTGHLLLGIVNPLALATPVLHPDLQGNAPCLDSSAAQGSDPIEQVGGAAIDAAAGTAEGVGSVIEEIGKDAGKLLDDITGN